jgi:hypothetical protein
MIEHCGEFIQKELSLSKRRLTKLTDILTLIQPDDISCSFKGMSAYLNSLFIFQFKQPMRRNELIKKQSFFLKGQMIVVNGGNSLLYMNSPHITNPQTLTDTNLFLADFQRHDATRDLIMLNQSHMKKTE